MWDSVTYVEPSQRTVIYEGVNAAHIIATNAGPSDVDLLVWISSTPTPKDPPNFTMRMPPGNTRSASGAMIAVSLPQGDPTPPKPRFAAVAWRIFR